MSAILHIYLFGGFRLAVDENDLPPVASVQARSVFAYLAMHRERTHTRDLLAGLFWPDLPEAMARRRLSQSLWRLRQTLQVGGVDSPLIIEAHTIHFDRNASCWLDVEVFEAMQREGDGESVSSRLFSAAEDFNLRLSGWEQDQGLEQETMAGTQRVSRLRTGVELYRGDFMAGFYDDWIIPERERLRDSYLSMLECLLTQHKDSGDFEEALRFARQLSVAEPLRETTHCEIMRLCHQLNRPQEALKQYKTLKTILTAELGIDPSPTASTLYRQILRGAEHPPPVTTRSQIPTSPFLNSTFSIPLVGREIERGKLTTSLDAAMLGSGGVALVGGEAGVGKTRLLQEIARDAGWRGMQVLWGWGKDRTSVSTYDILKQIVQSGVTPLRALQLEPLVDGDSLSALEVLLPNLSNLWPDLPTHIPLEPKQEQKRVYESLTRVLLSLGEIIPHLLILEDVHWATETALAALLHIAQNLLDSNIFIIISFRESEARERPSIWRMLQQLNETGRHERFELAELTDSGTRDLVQSGLGLHQPAPRFTQRVYQETGGNPLFVLETLRALHDDGVLYRDNLGEWNTPWDRTTTDYAELPVPHGVRQVIAMRLEKLDQDEREVLNAAAILGDRFKFSLLSRTVEQDKKSCTDAVHSLITRRFLEEEPEDFRFSHNLVRQIVISEMPDTEMKLRHRFVVSALENVYPDQIETLAYHGRRGEIWERAFIYNQKAGDRARGLYAGDKAVEFYTHAVDAWQHLGYKANIEYLALLQKRGEIFQETGQFDLAEDDFQNVIDLAAQMGSMHAHAEAGNSLSYLYFQRGDYDRALDLSIRAYDIALLSDSEAIIACALLNSANALRNMGRCTESIDFYRRAVAALEESDDEVRLADSLNRMGYAYIFNGQLAEAEVVMQRGLMMRRRLDDRIGLAYSLSNLSGLFFLKGDFAQAQEVADEAYGVATVAGDPYGQDAALQNLGSVYLARGLLDEAIDYFERAIAIAREIGDNPLVAEALADMGYAYARKGDLSTGRNLQLESISSFEDGGEIWYLCKAHEYLAEISLYLGDNDTAREQAHLAFNVASELDTPYLLGTSHRVMAEVLAHNATENNAFYPIPYFEKSLRCFQIGGYRASMARTLAAYGRHLSTIGDEDRQQRGAGMCERARSLFDELGMAWDLVNLDREGVGSSQPDRILIRLPLAGVPTGRPLREDEWMEVVWNIALVEDETIAGKVAKRRHRLLRLLREANEQRAAPRVDDLARALDASAKTIKRDLAALRAGGHNVHTRGSRRK